MLPTPHARAYLTAEGSPLDVTDFDPTQADAAGSMVSTLTDLNRFFRALLGGDVLPPPALAAMRADGLGLTRHETPTGPAFGYDGGFFGFETRTWHSTDGQRQLTLSATTTAIRTDLPPTATLLPALTTDRHAGRRPS